jgi:hypothetical protein
MLAVKIPYSNDPSLKIDQTPWPGAGLLCLFPVKVFAGDPKGSLKNNFTF